RRVLFRSHPPTGGATEAEELSGQAGKAAVHSEGRWQAAASRDISHGRQAAASGREATAGSNLRAGLSAVQLWVSATQRSAGSSGPANGEAAVRTLPL